MELTLGNQVTANNEFARNNGAIVLGGNVNGLGVIRSLGRLGAPCGLIFVATPGEHAFNSKYLSFACPVTDQTTDSELCERLESLSSELGTRRTALIPTSDRFSQFLSANKHSLSKNFQFNCCDLELCEAFLDKWNTATICDAHDLLTPSTICPSDFEELHSEAEHLAFPVIVKPRYTFDSRFPGKNAFISGREELLNFYNEHPVLGSSVIQQIIPSGDGDIIVLASYSNSDGKVVAMYSGRKLRQYLPDYGATCYGISERQPELEKMTTEFLDAIKYRGFAMIEFARSRHDGHFYFLELNTRTSWTNQLFADSGVDLSQIGFMEITGNDYRNMADTAIQRDGVVFLDFRRDFSSMRIKRQQGDIRFIDWFQSLFGARSFAFWDKSDPMPFIAACAFRIKSIYTTCLSLIRSRQTIPDG